MPTSVAVFEPLTILRLCGRVELEIAGENLGRSLPSGQATALLACLAMSRRPLSRDEMIDSLWPVRAPSDPQAVLSTLLSRLRRTLGREALVGRTQVELTLPEPVWLDVEAARTAVGEARDALAASAWERVLDGCVQACETLQRGFLLGHEAPWIDACRRDLEDLHLAALELEARGGIALGGAIGLERSAGAARRLIAIAPYREVGYGLLMEALEAGGNVAEALLVYERLRALLRDELGTAPAPELRALHERLVTGSAPGGANPGMRHVPRRPPTPIGVRSQGAVVGRTEELDRLEELWRSPECAMIAVAGEPGIGKTRLVAEFAAGAAAQGSLVLFGSCDEETLVPYQPFIEALQGYVSHCPVEQLRRQLADGGPELSRILPALRRRLPDLPDPPRSESETERFRLFELVAAFLAEIESSVPLVLAFEDLHWADRTTLLLMRHLFRKRDAGGPMPLIIVTVRSTEMGEGPSELLAELGRKGLIERLALAGLGASEVSTLIAERAGAEAPPPLTRAVYEKTAGNPFFVEELVRHLVEAGAFSATDRRLTEAEVAAIGVPEGVRYVVGRRLSRIAADARQVLTIAAVLGQEFSFDVLEHLTDLSGDALAEALEQSALAQLIIEQPAAFGLYSFSHALIRQTLHDELTQTRRVLLHRRIGETLEGVYADSLGAHVAELAHHFCEAARDGDPAAAIDYGQRAGQRAARQLAYEEAARHYERALGGLALAVHPQEERRCDLLVALGDVKRRAGEPAYRETLLEAARVARELADPERLARAALANNRGFFSSTRGVDSERVAMLEAALDAYDTDDSPVRARLLAHLGVELVPDPDFGRRASLSDDALAMARRTGDAETLAIVLNQRFATLWGPRTLRERRAACAEATELDERLDERTLAFYPPNFAAHGAMEAGELEQADAFLERAGALAGELAEPTLRWFQSVARAKRALITAAPADAEQLVSQAFELGRSAGQDDAFAWMGAQLFVVKLTEGRLHELLEAMIDARELFAAGSTARRAADAMNLTALSETGHHDDATKILEVLMSEDLTGLPHDWAALAIPALCALACARLGDIPRARALYTQLEPYAEQYVDMGPAWLGSTAHYLGLLAGTLDWLDEANAHFSRAVDAHRAIYATAWLARTQVDWAATLLTQPSAGDAKRAAKLLRDALLRARELGLGGVERQAGPLLESC